LSNRPQRVSKFKTLRRLSAVLEAATKVDPNNGDKANHALVYDEVVYSKVRNLSSFSFFEKVPEPDTPYALAYQQDEACQRDKKRGNPILRMILFVQVASYISFLHLIALPLPRTPELAAGTHSSNDH
jgi:hypothetical protein